MTAPISTDQYRSALGITLHGLSATEKTKRGSFDTAVNIMWIFNCAKHLPVYYRLMPGSIKDVSAFKVCLADSGLRDGVAIIDKGFQSASNIAQLDELGIKKAGNL